MKKHFLSLLLFSGIALKVLAQQDASVYDLQNAVSVALENNLSLKRSQLNQLITETTLLQNRGQRLPTLSTGSSAGFRWGRSINPVTNLFQTSRIGNINLSASSNATIYGGGRINNSINQSLSDLEAGEYTLEAARNDISLNIINLFINVVFNREQVKIAENQLLSTNDQLDRTSKLVAAGALPYSDQLDLQAQNATNRAEVINAKNNLRISKLNLSQAMQIPFSEDFDVLEPAFEVNELLIATESPSKIYEVALGIMPEIKAAAANVESADYGVKIAKGAFMPTFGLGANVFSNYVDQVFGFGDRLSFGKQIDNNLSQSGNLQLSIPLFSQFNNKAGLQRARVQRQLAEISAQEAKNKLRQDIESAFNSAIAAEQSYEASLLRVSSLQESFRISQQRFDIGAINSVDFQIAQNNLFNAQAELLNSKYTYIFSVKVLDFYLGNPINLN